MNTAEIKSRFLAATEKFGQPTPGYSLTISLFFRSLGVIYLIAFLSLSVQITGLLGENGILPVTRFLHTVSEAFGGDSWRHVPTLFWFSSSDSFLVSLCVAGAIWSLALIFGLAPRAPSIILFAMYLSVVAVGQAFLSFQWDYLLLETGFLAIFLKPIAARIWLARWLVFRLMFLSGAVKLLSGDPTWRNLTALRLHYETQPLPTPLAWYFHQLPGTAQTASTAVMFTIELAVPFLIFGPRRLRLIAAATFAIFQSIILLTGNYTFFNLLAIALCVMLCDDQALERWVPVRLKTGIREQAPSTRPMLTRYATIALVTLIPLLSSLQLAESFHADLPSPALTVLRWTAPFGIVNSYGLFAVMTTSRPEIVIEGSNDGNTWLEYEFRYKPGDVKRRPVWVEPHQPRLDWQMWFAALGDYEQNPWFMSLLERVLQGSPDVLSLFAKNPFPAAPPHFIRARVYGYHFTTFAEKRADGSWWRRQLRGEYFPAVSLRPKPAGAVE